MKRQSVFLLIVLILYVFSPTGASVFSLAFGEEFRYDSHNKRDPLIAPEVGLSGVQFRQGGLHLEGVVIDKKAGSYAIVNGQIVKEGTVLNGYLLKKVNANHAIFEKDGETVEAVLRQDDDLMKQYLRNEKK